MRVAQGWYQFNPKLSVRRRNGEEQMWTPIYAALNLPLVNEFAVDDEWDGVGDKVAEYLRLSGMAERTTPVMSERAYDRRRTELLAREKQEKELNAMLERLRQERAAKALSDVPARPPKWGTPEAKRMEIDRLRRETEAQKKG